MTNQTQNTASNNTQTISLNAWRWNRIVAEKHREDVNRELHRRQSH